MSQFQSTNIPPQHRAALAPPAQVHSAPMSQPLENNFPSIYNATYSNVPVFEMTIRGIAVMRRREDSFFNATQILKLAGVEKTQRTRILDTDIASGIHQKIQGGNGKYQGTWVPFDRAVELANAFHVGHLLAPLFDIEPPPAFGPTGSFSSSVLDHPAHLSGSLFNGAEPPALARAYSDTFAALPELKKRRYETLHGAVEQDARRIRTGPNGAVVKNEGHPEVMTYDGRHTNGFESAGGPHSGRDLDGSQEFGSQFANAQFAASQLTGPPYPNSQLSGPSSQFNGPNSQFNGSQFDAPLSGPAPSSPPPPSAPSPPVNGFNSYMAQNPHGFSKAHPAVQGEHGESQRAALKALFATDADVVPRIPADVPVDLPIDENSHTALHWACVLPRVGLARALVHAGADICRGNAFGETPLIRAVLGTNNYDADTFPTLLSLLAPSVYVLDHQHRTVLHHIALFASLAGRALCARYYLESVLEHIARAADGRFAEIVNVRDVYGDTALNVAARVGSRPLVTLLLDAGADRSIANNLGLRPGDFGLDGLDLALSPGAAAVAQLKATPGAGGTGAAPSAELVTSSSELLAETRAVLATIENEFAAEADAKTQELEQVRSDVLKATRELAEQRRQIATRNEHRRHAERRVLQIRNLKRAIAQEALSEESDSRSVDGLGDGGQGSDRMHVESTDGNAQKSNGSSLASPTSPRLTTETAISVDERDPPLPEVAQKLLDQPEGVVVNDETVQYLRRLVEWYTRGVALLAQRADQLEGYDMHVERRLKHLIAKCCDLEDLNSLDSMVDSLVTALECDDPGLDVSRIGSFLSKVKQNSLA